MNRAKSRVPNLSHCQLIFVIFCGEHGLKAGDEYCMADFLSWNMNLTENDIDVITQKYAKEIEKYERKCQCELDNGQRSIEEDKQ